MTLTDKNLHFLLYIPLIVVSHLIYWLGYYLSAMLVLSVNWALPAELDNRVFILECEINCGELPKPSGVRETRSAPKKQEMDATEEPDRPP